MTRRTGRIVPPEERCLAEECQSSRRSDVVPYCAFHARIEATRRAQIAYAERKRSWRERDAAAAAARVAAAQANALPEGEQAVARAKALAAAQYAVVLADKARAAERDIAEAVADGAECPRHPGEGLLECRGCEAIAEDELQGGVIDE